MLFRKNVNSATDEFYYLLSSWYVTGFLSPECRLMSVLCTVLDLWKYKERMTRLQFGRLAPLCLFERSGEAAGT
jgi:hypothetical protein